MKAFEWLQKNFSIWFLFITSIFFILLRFPSLFEPNWYGDEGIYQADGMLIRAGASLYSGAWDNKPPLLLVFYALFNSDQFIIRTVSLFFGLFSVWLIFFIAKKLFSENIIAISISTIIFTILFGTNLIEGNIANTENLIIFPILASALLILNGLHAKKSKQLKIYFSAGLVLSLAFLSKIVALFDFMAFTIFIFLASPEEFKIRIKNKLIPFFLGFGLPVIFTILYFYLTNNFKDFMDAFLLSNVGYVGLENHFIIPQGILYLKMIFLGLYLLIIYIKRNSINKKLLFILLWFGFTLFSAFFSQRPYLHYLLMFISSFSLILGAVIVFKKERLYLIALILFSLLIISRSFKIENQILSYYKNYINYTFGKIDTFTYQSYFDKNTPRDYEIANYIKANSSAADRIFIWGNNAQLYKLTNKTPLLRYTVAYHITGFPQGIKNMTDALNKYKPRYIIIMPNANEKYPLSLNGYSEKMDIRGALIYEKEF